MIVTPSGRLLCIRGPAPLNARPLGKQARVTNAALFVDEKMSRFANSSSGPLRLEAVTWQRPPRLPSKK